jgi:hypothetical protein
MTNLILKLVWLGILLCPHFLMAQTKVKKNSFNVGFSFFNFQDGYGFLKTNMQGNSLYQNLRTLDLYFEYERMLNKVFTISISKGSFYFDKYPSLNGIDHKSKSNPGDLRVRLVDFYNVGAKVKFITFENCLQPKLNGIFLISYQKTEDHFFRYYYPGGFDVALAGIYGKRFGVTSGLNGSVTFFNKINIGANIMYTYYFKDVIFEETINGSYYTAPKNYFLITPTIGVKF